MLRSTPAEIARRAHCMCENMPQTRMPIATSCRPAYADTQVGQRHIIRAYAHRAKYVASTCTVYFNMRRPPRSTGRMSHAFSRTAAIHAVTPRQKRPRVICVFISYCFHATTHTCFSAGSSSTASRHISQEYNTVYKASRHLLQEECQH